MTTVFIGGSRAISRLTPVIRERLDDLTRQRCQILVGDANGADRMVQRYLASQQYEDVVIYCMASCRNNVGNWETRRIESVTPTKNFAYYSAKDLAMAKDAKCGVMFWDGVSKGTLNNVQNLLRLGKKALVYLSTEAAFFKLSTHDDLEALLGHCDGAAIAQAQGQINRKLSTATQLSLTR